MPVSSRSKPMPPQPARARIDYLNQHSGLPSVLGPSQCKQVNILCSEMEAKELAGVLKSLPQRTAEDQCMVSINLDHGVSPPSRRGNDHSRVSLAEQFPISNLVNLGETSKKSESCTRSGKMTFPNSSTHLDLCGLRSTFSPSVSAAQQGFYRAILAFPAFTPGRCRIQEP